MGIVLTRAGERGREERLELPCEVLMPNGVALAVDGDGYVELEEVFDRGDMLVGVDALNDIAGERLVGSPLMEDIAYCVVGVEQRPCDGDEEFSALVRLRIRASVLAVLESDMNWEVGKEPETPSP